MCDHIPWERRENATVSEYFEYDIWQPKRRSANVKPGGGGGGGGGGLFLPFRIQEVQLSDVGCDESVLSICVPQDDAAGSGSQADLPAEVKFAPPEEGLVSDEGAFLSALDSEERNARMEASIAELLAALEARDGEVFLSARRRISDLATCLSHEEVTALEERISNTLGNAWWDFMDEDLDAAMEFQAAYLRQPAVAAPLVQAEAAPAAAGHATQVETKMAHAVMRYGGLHLGPRFRTRATTYGASGFRPSKNL
mmetsp:Transcript_77284/g.160753  ORF Transcript_77284/g.160753 Transcript_77284/m.160753 type:complete len:254 (+) Transcript_77284:130-891(+)